MEKRFYLSETDTKISGVCGGIAEYFGIDSLLVRAIFLFFVIVYGTGVMLYIILALLAPKRPKQP